MAAARQLFPDPALTRNEDLRFQDRHAGDFLPQLKQLGAVTDQLGRGVSDQLEAVSDVMNCLVARPGSRG